MLATGQHDGSHIFHPERITCLNQLLLSVPKIATIIHGFDDRLTIFSFAFRALWRSALSARVPESQIKNGRLAAWHQTP